MWTSFTSFAKQYVPSSGTRTQPSSQSRFSPESLQPIAKCYAGQIERETKSISSLPELTTDDAEIYANFTSLPTQTDLSSAVDSIQASTNLTEREKATYTSQLNSIGEQMYGKETPEQTRANQALIRAEIALAEQQAPEQVDQSTDKAESQEGNDR
jgi:hypothetical protein